MSGKQSGKVDVRLHLEIFPRRIYYGVKDPLVANGFTIEVTVGRWFFERTCAGVMELSNLGIYHCLLFGHIYKRQDVHEHVRRISKDSEINGERGGRIRRRCLTFHSSITRFLKLCF